MNRAIGGSGRGERFFSEPFERILASRQKGQTQQSATQKAAENRSIIEHAIGANDACQRCNIVKGLDLFNESSK